MESKLTTNIRSPKKILETSVEEAGILDRMSVDNIHFNFVDPVTYTTVQPFQEILSTNTKSQLWT